MPAPPLKHSLALSKAYGLLETGPVVLLTSSHKGAANVVTMSWHTMLEFEPPQVGRVVSQNDSPTLGRLPVLQDGRSSPCPSTP